MPSPARVVSPKSSVSAALPAHAEEPKRLRLCHVVIMLGVGRLSHSVNQEKRYEPFSKFLQCFFYKNIEDGRT